MAPSGCDDTDLDTDAKWEPLTMADLLRLLQPVESSWKNLAKELLKNNLQYKIATIQSNCFHNDTITKAIDDVFDKWLEFIVGDKRSWKTLCEAASKYGDDSLENYVKDPKNGLKKSDEPTMRHLQRWSQNSVLRIDWENFAVELIGNVKTRIIKATYFGGGDHACLRELLNTWWNSTTEKDHSWQVIVDALEQMGKNPVIKDIEKDFLRKK